ncbi:MAG TPA: CpaF family protein [Flexivirga sp.]|uniref:CpaF family protein n=1 Tax=Flexivirga sp. TaxID=1962927 RepID=UPI002B5166CC|nr:CpaF family protein [Flexivirga sp.]HWC22246.1 CpaF family protein [Flexivirga sp.]
MTNLADRIDLARQAQTTVSADVRPTTIAGHGRHSRTLDPFAPVKDRVHQALVESLGPRLYDPNLPETELATKVRTTLQSVIEAEQTPMSHADRTRIAQEISDDILGHGPLEPYLRDADITEIMVNGPSDIFVERGGRLYPTDASFSDDAHLRRTIDKIVARIGRRVDESSPMVDARLPDGSRVNAVVAPVALDGALLTIRKFAADPFTDNDLIAFGTMTPTVRDFLRMCVLGRRNILISGGTGSGKTTTLNVLSGFLPEEERIVTIEDAAELQLHQEHVLRMEARPPNIEGRGAIEIRDLVRNSLRMRPDRIIVGEVRDGAALDMLQAMNTGHDGSLTTVHANSPRDSLSRLETMVLMAGVDLPVRAIREQVSSAVDLIVQQTRLKDGTRRIVAITEVVGMESGIVTLQDLFTFDYSAGRDAQGNFLGRLVPTGIRPKLVQELSDHGIEVPIHFFGQAGL